MGGVLKNAKSKPKSKKVDVVVLRLHKDGSFANARPCRKCLCMMKNLSVRRVYYSSGFESEIKFEVVENMISIQDSSSSKHFCRTQYNYPRDDINYYKLIMNMHLPTIINKESLENFINYYLKDWINTLSFDLIYKYEKVGEDVYFRMFTSNKFTLFSMKVLI